jgi:hypothetical protein
MRGIKATKPWEVKAYQDVLGEEGLHFLEELFIYAHGQLISGKIDPLSPYLHIVFHDSYLRRYHDLSEDQRKVFYCLHRAKYRAEGWRDANLLTQDAAGKPKFSLSLSL